jgi:hypothetical protein
MSAQSYVIEPPCAVCGKPSARLQLIPPGGQPVDWAVWSASRRQSHLDAVARSGKPDHWWWLVEWIESSNGLGDPVTAERAQQMIAAFREPLRFAAVRALDFYDDAGLCGPCDAPYCVRHWNVSSTSYGRCPQGHGKSLDPFWIPWDDD